MTDPLTQVFTKIHINRYLSTPSPSELDDISKLLNDKSSVANIIYLESSMVPPVLSRVFRNGKDIDTSSTEYEKDSLVLSACPI